MKLKKGDPVIIIAGKDRGKTGTIETTLPRLNRVVVTGVNSYKKHVKASVKNPQGGLIESHRPINVSNVMYLDSASNTPTRLGFKLTNKDKVRIAKVTGKEVGK